MQSFLKKSSIQVQERLKVKYNVIFLTQYSNTQKPQMRSSIISYIISYIIYYMVL